MLFFCGDGGRIHHQLSLARALRLIHSSVQQVSTAIGVEYAATYTLPIYIALQASIYLRYFLDNIFITVVVVLAILGALLIYSLLLNNVEQKTYEYGMLRALGLKSSELIQLIGTKSFTFSVFGLGFGLLLAFIINFPVANIFAEFAATPAEYRIRGEAALLAVGIGLCIPLLANIAPIHRALSTTLRDSLDIYHSIVSVVTVRMIKLSEIGLDLWQTALSILMIVVGFVTFCSFRFFVHSISHYRNLCRSRALCLHLPQFPTVPRYSERYLAWNGAFPFGLGLHLISLVLSLSLSALRSCHHLDPTATIV